MHDAPKIFAASLRLIDASKPHAAPPRICANLSVTADMRNWLPTARKPAAAACAVFIVSGFACNRCPTATTPRAAYATAATPQPIRRGVACGL